MIISIGKKVEKTNHIVCITACGMSFNSLYWLGGDFVSCSSAKKIGMWWS